MPAFSDDSLAKLGTCHADLYDLFIHVVRGFDCTIVCGHRGKEDQNKAFDTGMTKVRWPNGKHNSRPSKAVDVIPYPLDWEDRERMHYFAGYVKAKADGMGIKIRWGGDWDGDTEVSDNRFDDLVHFELE